jgi:hypothetical protein
VPAAAQGTGQVEAGGRRSIPNRGDQQDLVFLTHIERRFGVPAGDFLRGLLHFCRIELVHLAPNLITIIATFIHLCEAYLSIMLTSTSGATSWS